MDCCTGNCRQGRDCDLHPSFSMAERVTFRVVLAILCVAAFLVLFPAVSL